VVKIISVSGGDIVGLERLWSGFGWSGFGWIGSEVPTGLDLILLALLERQWLCPIWKIELPLIVTSYA
jgi:hypothetical protein